LSVACSIADGAATTEQPSNHTTQ